MYMQYVDSSMNVHRELGTACNKTNWSEIALHCLLSYRLRTWCAAHVRTSDIFKWLYFAYHGSIYTKLGEFVKLGAH